MNKRIGYTTGVFDMFHVGHLNLIKNAKMNCDFLIVGVTTDEITEKMKNHLPIIPFEERIEIVKSIIYVDQVVVKDSMNNLEVWEKHKFNIFFKGDDWKNTQKGYELEQSFKSYGVEVFYLPYTKHTSSTNLRSVLEKINGGF